MLTNANEARQYFRDSFVGKFKTCTYAASANGTLCNNDDSLIQKLSLLKRCKLVGLREQADADIASKNNAAEKVECNIDPVMLLTVEQWK